MFDRPGIRPYFDNWIRIQTKNTDPVGSKAAALLLRFRTSDGNFFLQNDLSLVSVCDMLKLTSEYSQGNSLQGYQHVKFDTNVKIMQQVHI